MSVFRKIAVGGVLASYLFANTVASSFHDHGDCCSHSAGARCQPDAYAKSEAGREVGKPCCHHHHKHGPAGQAQRGARTSDSQSGRHERNGSNPSDSHHCVVCEFLALAPLAAPQVALLPAGEILPEFMVHDVVLATVTTIDVHLARGPPAA